MRKLFISYRAAITEERSLYRTNSYAVHSFQRQTIELLLRIAVRFSLVFGTLGVFIGAFREIASVFWLLCAAAFCLLQLVRRTADHNKVLLCTYVFMLMLLGFTTWIAARAPAEQANTVFVAMFTAFPIVLLDDTRRKLCFFGLCIGLHTAAMLFYRDEWNPVALLISACMLPIGFIVGQKIQHVRLQSYENHRIAELQRRTDFLTGLGNRFALAERLDTDPDRACPIQVLYMIDIDNFKKWNDIHGHKAGDSCLASLGARLLAFGEAHGLEFYRYGGEEILAMDTGLSGLCAKAIAEKLLQEARAMGFTVSIGYAMAKGDCYAAVDKADKALYAAKSAGKNCCVDYAQLNFIPLANPVKAGDAKFSV